MISHDRYRIPKYAVPAHGILKNYNTIEEFKAADKTALFNELSDEVRIALYYHILSQLRICGDTPTYMRDTVVSGVHTDPTWS